MPIMEKLKMFAVQEPVFGSKARQIHMGTEEPKDPFKDVDWKAVGGDMQNNPGDNTVVKKRRPKKLRHIPDFYFLPRRSLPYNIAFYGAFIAGGIGAGMLLEVWINKKVKVQKMEEELYGNFDKEGAWRGGSITEIANQGQSTAVGSAPILKAMFNVTA